MPTLVGLDIGTSAVRAVEVRTHGKRASLVKAGRVPLPPGAVDGGQVREPVEVTKAVRRLWHEQKFTTRSVRLGVGSGSVLVRPVELDWMPPQDLRKAMRFLVADLLPVPVDEANIDHVQLEDVERDGKRMVRVLLVATARDGVDETVRAVRAAGLRPTTADLSPLALVRAAARARREGLGDGAAGAPEAVVDVGAEKVAVAVHTDGLPRFVRVIPGLGGAGLTRTLAELLGPDADAEEAKRHLQLRPDAAGAVAAGAVRGAAQRIADEVRDTLRFHAGADPEHAPHRIVLSGLGGRNPGFGDLLAATVGLPVTPLVLPERRRSRHAETADDGDLAVGYGLCLGATA
ncbi:hypothetical protein GCM10023340_11590 [Nocardioides marinquilinus]|uniref:SHS2 domain-containing protein n=1 Tax=Nocardioides marinquilinus TaxID=1210400 RepID=A0ABP9PFC8_9ACTN